MGGEKGARISSLGHSGMGMSLLCIPCLEGGETELEMYGGNSYLTGIITL